MTLSPDTCYRALRARDGRFDGVFFVGVKTTGVYCRPICPARLPAPERCEFFARTAEAERAGFRACFRCRPELSPGLAPVDSIPRLVRAAAARIEEGFLNERSIDELAGSLGVTSRHLRRSMEAELGVSPVELAQTQRLALAKQLLQDTGLPLTEIAFASGFSSVRRFNALFLARFGRPPSALRRAHGAGEGADTLALRLDYRAPLDWPHLLGFLAERAIPGVEIVTDGEYRRAVLLGPCAGTVTVRAEPGHPALRARISASLAPKLTEVVSRLRRLFDLDARPHVIAEVLGQDELLRAGVEAHPGLRVPGAFDGFEMAVRAVLGQQVSVRAATTLSGRLVERFGEDAKLGLDGAGRTFPRPSTLASASVDEVRSIGLPEARARTLVELARAVADGRVDLSSGAEPTEAMSVLQSLPGIGAWTAQYLAMRALRSPNAFPSSDLGVMKALGVKTGRAAEERARAWEPWRAYAVMHLWNAHAQGGLRERAGSKDD